MSKKQQDKLGLTLFREYGTSAVRKIYVGPRKDLNKQEGYAWYSRHLGRWCFIALKQDFSIDNVVLVDTRHIRNL